MGGGGSRLRGRVFRTHLTTHGLDSPCFTIMDNFAEKASAYHAKALLRARRRRSPWNVVLLVLGFGTGLAAWYGFFRLVWMFHAAIYPAHRLQDFWQAGIGGRSFVLSFLMTFSLAPAAMIIGFLFANSVFWMIRPARRVFEREARGHEDTSFRDSMRLLLKACAWALPMGIGIAFAAAWFLESLR